MRPRRLSLAQALMYLKQPNVILHDILLGSYLESGDGKHIGILSHAAARDITPYIEFYSEDKYGRRFKIKEIFT